MREYRRMWGFLPYDQYLFLNLLTERSGGLEHKNSSVLMASRWATRTRGAYICLAGAGESRAAARLERQAAAAGGARSVRLRTGGDDPQSLDRGRHHRLLRRPRRCTAPACRREELLESLSGTIEELQTTPGRLVQSAELASFDAWIKYYRPDENSDNTSISYYTKGAVLGFLLDAKIRKATAGSARASTT